MVGMWVPNVALGGLGLFLLIRVANDRSVKIMSFLNFLTKKFKPSSKTS
jgi:hypothetical protein